MRTRRVRKSQKRSVRADATAGGEEPPHLEFLNRHLGTLPEAIREADLGVLNGALGILFDRLREARRQFEKERDHGRTGAYTALGALWQFVVLFEKANAQTLQLPILRLQDALATLDAGLVQPIVKKPAGRSGRAPSSHAHMSIKGHAAATVSRLGDSGLSRPQAFELVAKELNRVGVRPERGSGVVTASTVRNWCSEISSDVSRQSTAAIIYDDILAEERQFSSQTDARRFALASLSAQILALFPERKKLVKPHS